MYFPLPKRKTIISIYKKKNDIVNDKGMESVLITFQNHVGMECIVI